MPRSGKRMTPGRLPRRHDGAYPNNSYQNQVRALKVILHVGPHKTGTTSIQSCLKSLFGNESPLPPTWYPPPEPRGPGHAALADSLLNYDTSQLKRIVQKARSAEVERLLLSSENFCRIGDDSWRKIAADCFSGCAVTLVTTQNPMGPRISSIWQESIKQGRQATFESSVERILQDPGLSTTHIPEIARAIGASQAVVVYSRTNDPSRRLLENFLQAIGEDEDRLSNIDMLHENRRIGMIEVELFRRLNQLLSKNGIQPNSAEFRGIRTQLLRVFWSQSWQSKCPQVELPVPDSLLNAAQEHEIGLFNEFERLSAHIPVEYFGERTT
jgi:hypothetical protein